MMAEPPLLPRHIPRGFLGRPGREALGSWKVCMNSPKKGLEALHRGEKSEGKEVFRRLNKRVKDWAKENKR